MKKDSLDWMFWNDKSLKKLKVLNPDDFNPPAIAATVLKKRHGNEFFASLGLADEKEIMARNELMSFLFSRPELREKITAWLNSCRGLTSLPMNENDFLFFYEKENPYWKIVKELVAEVKKVGQLPERLIPFLEKVETSISELEPLEKDMATKISEKLKRVTTLEGVIDLVANGHEVNAREEDEDANYSPTIIGQKAFSATWSGDYEASIPNWVKKWFFRFIGLRYVWQKTANMIAANKARRSSIVEMFPTSIISDLRNGLWQLLQAKIANPKEMTAEEKKVTKFLYEMSNTIFQIYFKYNDEGLQITPINIKSAAIPKMEVFSPNKADRLYNGYTARERKVIKENLAKINREVSEAIASNNASKTAEFLSKTFGVTVGKSIRIKSNSTDESFRWCYIQNLYEDKEHSAAYTKLTSNRGYFWKGMNELHDLCKIIDLFEEKAQANNLPLCMPEITNKRIGVSFKAMGPIDMMDQAKKMVSFSFPEINGHIICLTGKHGRGKSVAGNSVLENLWLAQSGLPVFADEFRTDVKEMIGAVTNDTGDGSTATVFVKKTMNLFENIQKVPAHKSLIFIDEIGKGTQESAGLKLGQQILKALSQNGNSVIFNTQIMKLAEHARDNFQAICLKVDDNHQFQPGIGEGLMEELIHEVGLDKYLN